jgi:hypothetical protein
VQGHGIRQRSRAGRNANLPLIEHCLCDYAPQPRKFERRLTKAVEGARSRRDARQHEQVHRGGNGDEREYDDEHDNEVAVFVAGAAAA